MKKKLLLIPLAVVMGLTLAFAGGCKPDNDEAGLGGDDDWNVSDWGDWGDWGDWDDNHDWGNNDATTPPPSFDYNTGYNATGGRWIGVESCTYTGGELQNYSEDGYDSKTILTIHTGATVSFIVDSSENGDVWVDLHVIAAVNTGYSYKWASDYFELTINGESVDLNGGGYVEGQVYEKWVWQDAEWYKAANYKEFSFGWICLKNGENTFELTVKSDSEVQLDCFRLVNGAVS